MRVLCVIPFYKPAYVYGGPTRSIPTLCENLAALGCNVTVYTTNADGLRELPVTPNQACLIDGVEVHYFQRSVRGSYFYSAGLGRACSGHAEEFDLIYVASNWGYPFVPACRSAARSKVPYVVTPRTSFIRKTWQGKYLKKYLYYRLIEQRLINRAAALHYTTVLEQTESAWLALRPHSFVVPNPVDVSEFEQLPPRGSFRAKFALDEGASIVLYLGRVEPRKGLDLTLASFAAVAQTHPKAMLVIAGPEEDRYLQVLKRMAVDLDLEKRLVFTGFLDAKERLEALADTDIFILTSYFENFGMSVVEAMAAGRAIIISDQVGLSEQVRVAQAGAVVPLDVAAISDNLRELLGNPGQRKLMGQRAAELVREQYAPRAIARVMKDRFQDIINDA